LIQSEEDYKYYLEADRLSLGRKQKRPAVSDELWQFQRLLRQNEYFHNCQVAFRPLSKIYYSYLQVKLKIMSVLLGFTIPINVFGPGLSIAHRGNIIVNPVARIGKNCRIHVGVNIGTEAGYGDRAPIIGDNVYIGPGAKIFGKIEISNDIAIGANAVVQRSFTTPGVSIGGIPAIQISERSSEGLLIKGTELAAKKRCLI
jgi:serine O-acetyltransferase